MTIKRLSVATLCALLATACQFTGNDNAGNQQNDATDTVATKKQEALPFMSPDAGLLDIRGQIKQFNLTTTTRNGDGMVDTSVATFAFDANKCLIFDGNNFPEINPESKTVVRNDKGQLVKVETILSEEFSGVAVGRNYEYDEQGRVKVEDSYGYENHAVNNYIYNQQGDLARIEHKAQAEGYDISDIEEIEIIAKDSQGNWTKRKKSYRRTEVGIIDKTDTAFKDAGTVLEVRDIIYQ